MENDRVTYKRIPNNMNWWVLIFLVGIYIWLIFAYIHQWGNNPINKTVLIIIAVIYIVFWFVFVGGRNWEYKVIIDNKFVIFTSDLWFPCKIMIANINSVRIEQVARMLPGRIKLVGKNIEKHSFDSVKQAVSIQLKDGKIYQIAIKDAEKIKEEIEKRMNK